MPQNVVLARGLDTRSILDGVRSGRTWIAESAGVTLSFRCDAAGRTAGIGERLRVPGGTQVTATVSVSGGPGGAVRLLTDEGQLLLAPLDATGAGTVEWVIRPQVSAYVRAEVRRPGPAAGPLGAMVAMTNPVFLGETRD